MNPEIAALPEDERIAHAFGDTGDIDTNRLRTAQHAPLMQRLIIEALVEEKRALRGALAQVRLHAHDADTVRTTAEVALAATIHPTKRPA